MSNSVETAGSYESGVRLGSISSASATPAGEGGGQDGRNLLVVNIDDELDKDTISVLIDEIPDGISISSVELPFGKSSKSLSNLQMITAVVKAELSKKRRVNRDFSLLMQR